MRIRNKTGSVVLPAIVLGAVALAFMTPDERCVAAPALAGVIIVIWLWMTLWDRDQNIPFFDVGVFCALATLVYMIYPLVNYWVEGFQFGILSDSRLASYNIEPFELGVFHLRHLLYLFFFVVFYLAFRGRGIMATGNVNAPSRSAVRVIILFFLMLSGYFVILQVMTGVNFNTSYESEAFEKNRIAIANLPVIVMQISSKLSGILFVFKLAFLFFVVTRCRRKTWLWILLVWIGVEIVQTFILKGARTGLVLFLIATALLYHRMVKPLTMKFLLTSGTLLFIAFMFLGLYRSYVDVASFQEKYSEREGGILAGGNEFQALLATAYDVSQRKKSGTDLPWYLHINDIITVLPPQQLVPFEKVAASEWYLRELGLSGTGKGLMWGVITQSIVGFDWLELALRGALLGYILARIHRWYLKHQTGFMETLVYMFLCLKVYYTFRDTTFYLLANIVWEIIPFYILLRLGVAFLSQSRSSTPALRVGAGASNIG